jgi:uncharacterized protein YheU (UPF0270 family)
MQLSSAQCRAQEAIQWKRAESEPLENVRMVALRAAIAWGHEAKAAEKREASKRRTRLIAEFALSPREQTDNGNEETLSENPDRGFANA